MAKGAAAFNYSERTTRSGQKNGNKITGIGVGQAFHPAGFAGFDGLVRITPDGKIHLHTGVGNLGTYSHSGTQRVAAEALKANWENCIVERGDTRKGLPWNIGQFGSNTSFTMSRSSYAAAMDAVGKLKEIAAMDLGGKADDYDIADEKVFRKSDPGKSLTYAQAAKRAIELGGKFDGHESPADVNPMTSGAAKSLAGHGALIGIAKDNMPLTAQPAAFVAGFIEISLDTETGAFDIVDYVARSRLRHGDPSAEPRDADQGRRSHGLRPRDARAPHLRSAERPAAHRRPVPGEAGELSRRGTDVHDGRSRQARSAEPARHEGYRRARHGRWRLVAACVRFPMHSAATCSIACRSCAITS